MYLSRFAVLLGILLFGGTIAHTLSGQAHHCPAADTIHGNYRNMVTRLEDEDEWSALSTDTLSYLDDDVYELLIAAKNAPDGGDIAPADAPAERNVAAPSEPAPGRKASPGKTAGETASRPAPRKKTPPRDNRKAGGKPAPRPRAGGESMTADVRDAYAVAYAEFRASEENEGVEYAPPLFYDHEFQRNNLTIGSPSSLPDGLGEYTDVPTELEGEGMRLHDDANPRRSRPRSAPAPRARPRGDSLAGDIPKADRSRINPGIVNQGESLVDDFVSDMLSISPDEFDAPTREVPLTLKQVALAVLRDNRAIRAASFKTAQATADIMAAKSVYDPELFGDYTYSQSEAPPTMSISGMSNPNRKFKNELARAGVRQRMPSGGKLSAYREWNSGTERSSGLAPDRGSGGAYVLELTQPILNGFADMENRTLIQISELQTDVTREEFRQLALETMSKALEAYWTAAQAREEVRISEESLDLAQRLLERELGRKNEGISTQLDVNRAREAAATRAYNLQLAREQRIQAQENLKYLINDKTVPVGMDVFVDVVENMETPLVRADLQKAIDVALERRPEMQGLELAVRMSDARRRYAKHTLLPELNIVGSVRRNDKGSSTPTTGSSTLNTGTDWSLGMEFSLPLGNMEARANLKKYEAEIEQRHEEKRDIRDYIITEVRTLVKNMDMVAREIPLNKRAMEAAEKVLEGEWAKLELNQTGNNDLLQAQDLVAVTQKNYIGSMVRYNVYIIRLLAAQGILLDKMGIEIEL